MIYWLNKVRAPDADVDSSHPKSIFNFANPVNGLTARLVAGMMAVLSFAIISACINQKTF